MDLGAAAWLYEHMDEPWVEDSTDVLGLFDWDATLPSLGHEYWQAISMQLKEIDIS